MEMNFQNGALRVVLGRKNSTSLIGYLSVRFDDYWKSDLDFDIYVQDINNKGVIERSWILQKIETHNDTKRKGILLSSDMGFGKSNIVCADTKSIWYSLRQQILKRNETIVPNIPDVFDKQGLSILQYGLNKSVSADDLIRINTLGRDDFTFSLFLVVISYNHNLFHTDKQKNNFLHYASKAGNNWVFELIRDLDIFKGKLHLLLNQRNQNNRTPLEVAFDSLPRRKSFEAIKIPENCSLSDVFFVKCKANFSVLLSPHEYFILTVFQYFYKKENVAEIKISELLEISIRKSRIYPILNIMKVYAEREFQYTLERSVKIPMVLSESNSPYITELLLNAENALRCDGQRSALHEIVHNDRNIQWTFHSLSFLHPIFRKYSAKFLDECFDDRGYNLLHRSIIGAHLNTILYFINQGMNIWQPSKNNQTCLEISIFNSPYTDNGDIPTNYTRGSRFHSIQYVSSGDNKGVRVDSSRLISFDETASFLLDKMTQTDENKRKFIRNQLCDSKNIHFGLIHFAAAKGLFKFLKSTRGIYGLDYLRCEDKFGVTPFDFNKMENIPSELKTLMNKLRLRLSIIQRCVKMLEKKTCDMMRKLMLFGADDKYFYYRRLLSSVKMKSSSLGENKKFNVSKLLFGVYDTNYSHFRRLQMRSELHSFWLKQNRIQSTDDLQMFFKYQTKYFQTLDDMLLASKKCV
ncbi:unnamed protein product [Mytilus edulis]|uniref:Uncharacterized protein n=1 Tax=Mytilus edulis TaxID=6550 RepID=A0A8S3THI5_MYTED|nr:unnamed protein product [Mytilus edulis]